MKKSLHLSFITVSIIAAFAACVTASCKKSTGTAPTPKKVQPAITAGSYKIIEDQGSDNGDTVYYTRTLSACEVTARYTFTATTLTLTSSCTATGTATWSFNPTTAILTVTDDQGRSGPIKIEHLTATGFIWNAIATGQDNARYTMQLVQ